MLDDLISLHHNGVCVVLRCDSQCLLRVSLPGFYPVPLTLNTRKLSTLLVNMAPLVIPLGMRWYLYCCTRARVKLSSRAFVFKDLFEHLCLKLNEHHSDWGIRGECSKTLLVSSSFTDLFGSILLSVICCLTRELLLFIIFCFCRSKYTGTTLTRCRGWWVDLLSRFMTATEFLCACT